MQEIKDGAMIRKTIPHLPFSIWSMLSSNEFCRSFEIILSYFLGKDFHPKSVNLIGSLFQSVNKFKKLFVSPSPQSINIIS